MRGGFPQFGGVCPNSSGDGLGGFGAVVVAEAVVGEAQGFGQHPAFAIVEVEEGVEAEVFEVVEGNQGKNSVAQFGVFFFIYTPKAFGF